MRRAGSLLAALALALQRGRAARSSSSFLRPGAEAAGLRQAQLQWPGQSGNVFSGLQTFSAADSCDLFAQGPVCSSDQQHLLVPSAVQGGLVGHWNFDSAMPYDSSGNGNHGNAEVPHGPSPAGSGSSAFFRQSFMVVPNAPSFRVNDFAYSFWLYLLEEGTAGDLPRHCPVLRKGVYSPRAETFAAAPAILLNHKTRQLRASVTTTVASRDDGEALDSGARLVPGQWTHVGLVHHASRRSLLLYVNGILDSTMKIQGEIQQNDYPLYVGGDPFTSQQCRHGIYMDELRVYNRALSPHELQAEAGPGLAGLDPAALRLGCFRCPLLEAEKACPKGSHICSSLELHTGGYEVARALGWFAPGTHVWTEAAVAKARSQPLAEPATRVGLGLCCRDF